MSKLNNIIGVTVWLDEEVPEYMQGIIRIGDVQVEYESGEEGLCPLDLVDNQEFWSYEALIESVAKRLGVDPDIITIE